MVTHGMILRFIHHVVLFFKGSAIWLNQASRVIPVTKFVAYKWQNSSPNPLTFLKFSSLTSIVQRLVQKSSPVLRPSSFRARHPLPLIFRFSFSFSKMSKIVVFSSNNSDDREIDEYYDSFSGNGSSNSSSSSRSSSSGRNTTDEQYMSGVPRVPLEVLQEELRMRMAFRSNAGTSTNVPLSTSPF